MTQFPIHRVDRRSSQSVETLGSRRKFWFSDDDRRLLFKADDRNAGDDWAEVISCHLCDLLHLPHVEYEFATEFDEQVEFHGVICENMAAPPLSLVPGNVLLFAFDPLYPRQQRKVRQHTVTAVAEVVSKLEPPADSWITAVDEGIRTALDFFVGYVMLDAWIANQDRHHQNWGAIFSDTEFRLAPTFDHGAALARNLQDREREDRLTTTDQRRTIAAFAQRSRSQFFGSVADPRPLGLHEAFVAFAKLAPNAASSWLERLRAVNKNAIWGILERSPPARMSELCMRFTTEFLLTNQRRLLEWETNE